MEEDTTLPRKGKAETGQGVTSARPKAVLRLAHEVGGRTVALVSLRARALEGKWHVISAYLDSGAHTSVFTAATLELLGGIPATEDMVTLRDAGGRSVTCNLVPIEVWIGKLRAQLEVAVPEGYRQDFNILGIDFFTHFRITFDVAHRRVTLEEKG
jgi:hypothetical protein